MNWQLIPNRQGVQRVGSNRQVAAFNATNEKGYKTQANPLKRCSLQYCLLIR
jgi:hypothetical protein